MVRIGGAASLTRIRIIRGQSDLHHYEIADQIFEDGIGPNTDMSSFVNIDWFGDTLRNDREIGETYQPWGMKLYGAVTEPQKDWLRAQNPFFRTAKTGAIEIQDVGGSFVPDPRQDTPLIWIPDLNKVLRGRTGEHHYTLMENWISGLADEGYDEKQIEQMQYMNADWLELGGGYLVIEAGASKDWEKWNEIAKMFGATKIQDEHGNYIKVSKTLPVTTIHIDPPTHASQLDMGIPVVQFDDDPNLYIADNHGGHMDVFLAMGGDEENDNVVTQAWINDDGTYNAWNITHDAARTLESLGYRRDPGTTVKEASTRLSYSEEGQWTTPLSDPIGMRPRIAYDPETDIAYFSIPGTADHHHDVLDFHEIPVQDWDTVKLGTITGTATDPEVESAYRTDFTPEERASVLRQWAAHDKTGFVVHPPGLASGSYTYNDGPITEQWKELAEEISKQTKIATVVKEVPVSDAHGSGHPFFYDTSDDTLYIGAQEGFHTELMIAGQLPLDTTDYLYDEGGDAGLSKGFYSGRAESADSWFSFESEPQ
jgi:uncharacterized protein YuzE